MATTTSSRPAPVSMARGAAMSVVVCLGLGMHGTVQAGGFGLQTQSASALGNSFAGAVAAAEDASTVWFNPAGMGRLKGAQSAVVANVLQTSFQFRDRGSTGAFALGADGGNGGGVALVPQAYLSWSAGDDLRLGLGFNTPYGLKTDYDAGWRGQFTALLSEAAAYNLNPSVAFRIPGGHWIGAGVNLQRFSTELTNFAGPLGQARLRAGDSAWGFNLGALFEVGEHSRIGVAYRSSIRHQLEGNAQFSNGAGVFDSGVRADLRLPESLSIGAVTSASERWELLASATWTRWSRLQSLDVTRTTPSALGPVGSTVTTLPFHWRDAVLVALGASYRLNEAWKLRFGLAVEPAVSNDLDRTARLPDQARRMLSIGARYAPASSRWSFDVAAGREFVKEASITNTVAGVPGQLAGRFRSAANVLSLQANYAMQ